MKDITNKKQIRVLHFVPYLQAAGSETYIMNMYRNIDRNKVQFDFVVHSAKKSYYDDEIKKLGGNIYYMTIKDDKNIFKYIHDIRKLFKNHREYKIIHSAMPSLAFLYLSIAKMSKIPIRIAHSHSASYEKNIKGVMKHITTKFIPFFSNEYFACSNEAGKYMFGKRKFSVLNNAIDLEKYKFNKNIRKKIKKELKIEDETFVIGHVGRFSSEKNHIFMLNVLKKLIQKRENTLLIFIGTGALEEKIKEQVKNMKLEQNVLFLGVRNNVNEIMQAFNIQILPSLFEGLPITIIESQANGLITYCSDKVSLEAKLTDKIIFLPLDEKIWVKNINETQKEYDRENFKKDKLYEKYNVKTEAKKLQDRYFSLLEGE